jgi:hypothetical protein
MAGSMMKELWAPGLGRYLLRHPSHAATLARAGWRLRRDGWLSSRPHLPLPDPAYWKFRVTTVNGSSHTVLSPTSLVDAATWALRQPVRRRS